MRGPSHGLKPTGIQPGGRLSPTPGDQYAQPPAGEAWTGLAFSREQLEWFAPSWTKPPQWKQRQQAWDRSFDMARWWQTTGSRGERHPAVGIDIHDRDGRVVLHRYPSLLHRVDAAMKNGP